MDIRSILLWLNLAVSLASSAWALVALNTPTTLSSSITVSQGERFYVRMYAARAVPLGVAAGVLPLWAGGTTAGWIVLTAGLVQSADIWIGGIWRKRDMMLGASIGMAVNFCTACVMSGP